MTLFAHTTPMKVKTRCSEDSLGYWSNGLPQKLVLFVHGFGGSAGKTWDKFPSILITSPGARNLDVLSYQYDGRFTQASNSAAELADFLKEFLHRPSDTINRYIPADGRPAQFRYARIVIAAHSLGAVVTRLALLRLLQERGAGDIEAAWLDDVRMVLYAPAHTGAYAAELAEYLFSQADSPLFTLAAAAVKHKMPLLEDLRPGSPVLKHLHEVTEKNLARNPPSKSPFVAKVVVWAKDEKIVMNLPFCEDPAAKLYPGSHTEVCKPSVPTDATVGWLMNAFR